MSAFEPQPFTLDGIARDRQRARQQFSQLKLQIEQELGSASHLSADTLWSIRTRPMSFMRKLCRKLMLLPVEAAYHTNFEEVAKAGLYRYLTSREEWDLCTLPFPTQLKGAARFGHLDRMTAILERCKIGKGPAYTMYLTWACEALLKYRHYSYVKELLADISAPVKFEISARLITYTLKGMKGEEGLNEETRQMLQWLEDNGFRGLCELDHAKPVGKYGGVEEFDQLCQNYSKEKTEGDTTYLVRMVFDYALGADNLEVVEASCNWLGGAAYRTRKELVCAAIHYRAAVVVAHYYDPDQVHLSFKELFGDGEGGRHLYLLISKGQVELLEIILSRLTDTHS